MDLVRKMMEDPKLLGTMLKKPKSDVENKIGKSFVNFVKRLWFKRQQATFTRSFRQ